MWHALRAELAYCRPWLFGGLGIAAGVIVLISVVFHFAGEGPAPHAAAGLRGMFLIMAPMIVAFIVQGYRTEERRARLLLAGPLTPRQLAAVMVLLPVVLFGIGVPGAALVIGAELLITGSLELETLNMVGFVGGQFFTYAQLAFLVQEAVAAHGQRRRRAAVAGWVGFVVAVLLLAPLYLVLAREIVTWAHLLLGHLVVALAAMAASVELYAGRTDFTR